MSVKYTVRHQGVVIGTRRSAGHLAPIYTHAVVRILGDSYDVLSYCSRLDLANKEAGRRYRSGDSTIVVLPVEAQVTTKAPKAEPMRSWKVEVQADSSGTWAGNGVRYASKAVAENAARDLAWRWTSVREWRVVESPDAINAVVAPAQAG